MALRHIIIDAMYQQTKLDLVTTLNVTPYLVQHVAVEFIGRRSQTHEQFF